MRSNKNKQKIRDKSKCFWKHGKHKGLKEVAIRKNNGQKKNTSLELIDMSVQNWSTV